MHRAPCLPGEVVPRQQPPYQEASLGPPSPYAAVRRLCDPLGLLPMCGAQDSPRLPACVQANHHHGRSPPGRPPGAAASSSLRSGILAEICGRNHKWRETEDGRQGERSHHWSHGTVTGKARWPCDWGPGGFHDPCDLHPHLGTPTRHGSVMGSGGDVQILAPHPSLHRKKPLWGTSGPPGLCLMKPASLLPL